MSIVTYIRIRCLRLVNNSATCLRLSQVSTWIPNAILCGHMFVTVPSQDLDSQCHIMWSHVCDCPYSGPGFPMPYYVVTCL